MALTTCTLVVDQTDTNHRLRLKLVSGIMWRWNYEEMVLKYLSEFCDEWNFSHIEILVELSRGMIDEIKFINKVTGEICEIDDPEMDRNDLCYGRLFYEFQSIDSGKWTVSFSKGKFSCGLDSFKTNLSKEGGMSLWGELANENIVDRKNLLFKLLKETEVFFKYHTSFGMQEVIDIICRNLELKPQDLQDFQISFGYLNILKIKSKMIEEAVEIGRKHWLILDHSGNISYKEKDFRLQENPESQLYSIDWHKTFSGRVSLDEVESSFEKGKLEIIDFAQGIAMFNEKQKE